MPKGGKRVGAGRKKRRAPVLAMPGVTVPHPAETATTAIAPPKGVLGAAAQRVWRRLAPSAIARATLTPETAHGFAVLCQSVVRLDELERRLKRDGWTFVNQFGEPKRHPLWGTWQVMVLRVEQQLARYGLMPDGRPAGAGSGQPEQPANPWAAIARR